MNDQTKRQDSINTPTIAQPINYPQSDTIGLVKSYPLSLAGLLRLGLILFQFAGFISAASAAKYLNGKIYLPPDMNSTRDAYLFFSIIGFIISIIIYGICVFNLLKVKPLNKIQFNLFIIGTDTIWLVPTFVLAIVSAVREGSIKDPFYLYSKFFNPGAFASASAFGFLCAFLYAIDGGFHLMKQIRKSN